MIVGPTRRVTYTERCASQSPERRCHREKAHTKRSQAGLHHAQPASRAVARAECASSEQSPWVWKHGETPRAPSFPSPRHDARGANAPSERCGEVGEPRSHLSICIVLRGSPLTPSPNAGDTSGLKARCFRVGSKLLKFPRNGPCSASPCAAAGLFMAAVLTHMASRNRGGVDLGHSVRWMGDQPAAGTLSGYPRVKASLCKKVPQRERTRLVSSAVQNKSPFHSLVSRS